MQIWKKLRRTKNSVSGMDMQLLEEIEAEIELQDTKPHPVDDFEIRDENYQEPPAEMREENDNEYILDEDLLEGYFGGDEDAHKHWLDD